MRSSDEVAAVSEMPEWQTSNETGLFKSLMLWSLALRAFDHVRRITLNTPLKQKACLELQT